MKRTRFEEIVFVDDIFRSSDNFLQAQTINRRFLRRTFGLAASRLGISTREEFAQSEGGRLDVAAMMAALGLPCSAQGWAMICIADLRPLAAGGLLPAFSASSLVIGWGMAPSFLNLLDAQGAVFIDLEVAPVRFASHLNFCARTNDPQIALKFEAWRIDNEDLWNEATILQGYFSRRSAPHLFDPKLNLGLFCGQSKIDLALVRDGQIVEPRDLVDAMRVLAGEVDLLVIKPHPYEPALGHLVDAARAIPNVAWTDANIYALMCAENVRYVSGLSSSALQEAPYFLKEAIQLIVPDRSNPLKLPRRCSEWITIGPDIMSRHGLAELCAYDSAPATTSVIRVGADALDRAFGVRWGLDAQNPGLDAGPTLVPGQFYEFVAGTHQQAWLSFGWGRPEASGVWTTGERACIVIPAAIAGHGEGLRVFVEGHVFVGPFPGNPAVRAWLNGRMSEGQVADGVARHGSVRFEMAVVPADIDSGALVIELSIVGPQRPCDWGINDDARSLGFCLKRVSVDSVATQEEPAVAVPAVISEPLPSLADISGSDVSSTSNIKRFASVSAAACIAVAGAALLQTPVPVAGSQAARASTWSALKRNMAVHMNVIREDLHSLIRRHEA